MPILPTATRIGIAYDLKFDPADLPTHEMHRLTAMQAARDLQGLGEIVSNLSAGKLFGSDDHTNAPMADRARAMDSGLFVLGQLIAGLAVMVEDCVEAYHTLLTVPDEPVTEA